MLIAGALTIGDEEPRSLRRKPEPPRMPTREEVERMEAEFRANTEARARRDGRNLSAALSKRQRKAMKRLAEAGQ